MSAREGLHRRFFRLALINILTNVTVPLVGLVDTAMLGHLADIRFLAGVALASILFDYVYWSFGFLRMGATGTTAQAVGRDDTHEVYLVLYRFLALAATLGFVLIVLKWPLRELGFLLLSGEPGVEAAGRDYFDARIWGAPATLCNYAFLGWYLGREESRHALVMTVIGNLANVALNYVFIIRMGLAAQGAGLATMVSQYLMLAVAVTIFRRLGRPVAWRWREVMHRGRLVALSKLNLDIMIRTFCLQTTFAVFTNFSSLMGTTILAANAIILRLLLLASFFIDGAAFASESLAGIFRGQGDFDRLRKLVRLSLLSGLGFAVLFLVGLGLTSGLWYRLLTSHDDVILTASRYHLWFVPVLLFGSQAYMWDGVFLGLTAGRALRNSMFVSTVLVFLPVAVLALYLGSPHLLWAALVVFMVARTVTLGLASRGLLQPGPPSSSIA
jgi:MATE family multidrug resistance protein